MSTMNFSYFSFKEMALLWWITSFNWCTRLNATVVICLVNRLHDNSFQERGSCFKGRRRYWNIVKTLNCSLPNDDHTLLTLMLLEMARETRKRKMETKNRNSLPIPCVVPFFSFFHYPCSLSVPRPPFPLSRNMRDYLIIKYRGRALRV